MRLRILAKNFHDLVKDKTTVDFILINVLMEVETDNAKTLQYALTSCIADTQARAQRELCASVSELSFALTSPYLFMTFCFVTHRLAQNGWVN